PDVIGYLAARFDGRLCAAYHAASGSSMSCRRSINRSHSRAVGAAPVAGPDLALDLVDSRTFPRARRARSTGPPGALITQRDKGAQSSSADLRELRAQS